MNLDTTVKGMARDDPELAAAVGKWVPKIRKNLLLYNKQFGDECDGELSDIAQTMLADVVQARESYDPSKATLPSFVYMKLRQSFFTQVRRRYRVRHGYRLVEQREVRKKTRGKRHDWLYANQYVRFASPLQFKNRQDSDGFWSRIAGYERDYDSGESELEMRDRVAYVERCASPQARKLMRFMLFGEGRLTNSAVRAHMGMSGWQVRRVRAELHEVLRRYDEDEGFVHRFERVRTDAGRCGLAAGG